MPWLDDRIAHLGGSGSLVVALLLAALLGLRHATDPDHLTAVSTLVLGDGRRGARRAARLGLAWGAGHACTLLLLGVPLLLLHALLPEVLQRAAELAVGVLIAALALRLLVRWRAGSFHVHEHEHDGVRHAHAHVHGPARHHGAAHAHKHAGDLGRTPLAAFGIGLVHGAGGSAGAGVLLLAAIPERGVAAVALVLFAGMAAVSMALVSAGWGRLLASGVVSPRLGRLAPAMGACGLAFGVWYGLAALG